MIFADRHCKATAPPIPESPPLPGILNFHQQTAIPWVPCALASYGIYAPGKPLNPCSDSLLTFGNADTATMPDRWAPTILATQRVDMNNDVRHIDEA